MPIRARTWVAALLAAIAGVSPAGGVRAEDAAGASLDEIIEHVEDAKRDYDDARRRQQRAGDEVEKTKAGKAVADAEHEYRTRVDALDGARTAAIAEHARLSPEEIAAMRAGGKSWGGIARELGVPASALGKDPAGWSKGKHKSRGVRGRKPRRN